MKNKKIIGISICAVIGILLGGILLGFSFSQGTKLSVKYDLKKLENQEKNSEDEMIKESFKYDKKLVFSNEEQLRIMIEKTLYKKTGKVYYIYRDNRNYYDVLESYIESIKTTQSYKDKKYIMLKKCINNTCLVFFNDAYRSL